MPVALVIALTSSLLLSSCWGSCAFTRKIYAWNAQVGGKFTNELVFLAMCILPVYPLGVLADMIVLNTIEFWSGNNPMQTAETKIINGKDAPYRVTRNADGYVITNLNNGNVTRFNFDAADNSWSVQVGDENVKFMTFVDDNHVRMLTPDGTFTNIELSTQGILAYSDIVAADASFALR